MIHPDLLSIIACPESRQPLSLADDAMVEKLNAAIEKGGVKNVGGADVAGAVEAALVREDGQVVYLIRDSIPVLLVDEGIRVDSLG